ncbi:MAG: nucleotidyl transferase AbiEii/AbiGii toxin family protein [Lachnospiraceae bacterium]|nr:nucleotidyl transferase AbiEii/AbiGii toxin family protein [Lachnospiraceae bacterium]
MLHDNKVEFKEILHEISMVSGIRADILEKDYYVTLMLSEISSKQIEIPMFFKGGTALYKILNEPRRFSEDIDLTVSIKGKTRSQAKKTLELASNHFNSLNRLKGDLMEENKKGSITAVYGYDSVCEVQEDPLQRFEKLKVETTSFTVSEPTQQYEIASLLYSLTDDIEFHKLLQDNNVGKFSINTLTLERMLADKMLAAEFYYQREEYFDVAKHLYDINTLLGLDEIKRLITNDDDLINILSYKRIEEINRIGSNLDKKPLNEFTVFSQCMSNDKFLSEYEKMLNIYVIKDIFKTPLSEIKSSLEIINHEIISISDKEREFLNSKSFSDRINNLGIINEELSNIIKQIDKESFVQANNINNIPIQKEQDVIISEKEDVDIEEEVKNLSKANRKKPNGSDEQGGSDEQSGNDDEDISFDKFS